MDWEAEAFEMSTSWQRRGHVVDSGLRGAPGLNGTKMVPWPHHKALLKQKKPCVLPGGYPLSGFAYKRNAKDTQTFRVCGRPTPRHPVIHWAVFGGVEGSVGEY